MAQFLPKWTAYEMRLMAGRYVSDGMIPWDGEVERLVAILGRLLHSYRDFAAGFVGQTAQPCASAIGDQAGPARWPSCPRVTFPRWRRGGRPGRRAAIPDASG